MATMETKGLIGIFEKFFNMFATMVKLKNCRYIRSKAKAGKVYAFLATCFSFL